MRNKKDIWNVYLPTYQISLSLYYSICVPTASPSSADLCIHTAAVLCLLPPRAPFFPPALPRRFRFSPSIKPSPSSSEVSPEDVRQRMDIHRSLPVSVPIHPNRIHNSSPKPGTFRNRSMVLFFPHRPGCIPVFLLSPRSARQRNKTIQPVRHSLPSVLIPADPLAVSDIRPDQIQMPG